MYMLKSAKSSSFPNFLDTKLSFHHVIDAKGWNRVRFHGLVSVMEEI